MSVILPTTEEPTHEEFVHVWTRCPSVHHVSVFMAAMRYFDMTPTVVMRWYQHLVSHGVNLKIMRSPTKEEKQWFARLRRRLLKKIDPHKVTREEVDAMKEHLRRMAELN